MTNNYDAEAAKKIILDDSNINVTVKNPFKDLFQIIINLVLILLCVYFVIYVFSGVFLMSMSPERQVAVEKLISPKVSTKVVELSDAEQARLYKIRDNILKVDYKFPKTSNVDINVIDKKQLNALCYPNGNIYITSELYKYLTTDERLTFVIAHEMGHYKHKDHLLNLRRNLSNSAVLILISIMNPNNADVTKVVEGGLVITDLKYSRNVEEKADKYAIKIMNAIYGNAQAGVEVMNILEEKNHLDIEFLSSHPNIKKRIRTIQKLSN